MDYYYVYCKENIMVDKFIVFNTCDEIKKKIIIHFT